MFLLNSQCYIAFDEFCSPTRPAVALIFLAKAKSLRPRPRINITANSRVNSAHQRKSLDLPAL